MWRQDEAFEGPLAAYGPDLVVGFAPGYRASAETGLGEWRAESVVANHDAWGADHCVAAAAVPGVLFHSEGLSRTPHPSYHDIPVLTVGANLAPPTHLPPPNGRGRRPANCGGTVAEPWRVFVSGMVEGIPHKDASV